MNSACLEEFKKVCQRYYICYVFSVRGLKSNSDFLLNINANRDNTLNVGKGDPENGMWHGSMKIGDLIDSSQKDGDFSDQIAKSFICAIYSLWDEYYRNEIAKENGVNQKNVKSNLMGDVRHIRNCIVHNKSIVTNQKDKIAELNWEFKPGFISITEKMFQDLVSQINSIKIEIVV